LPMSGTKRTQTEKREGCETKVTFPGRHHKTGKKRAQKLGNQGFESFPKSNATGKGELEQGVKRLTGVWGKNVNKNQNRKLAMKEKVMKKS